MLSVENGAPPAAAAAVVVPDKVPAPGLVPSATVTFPVNPLAVFPWASRTVTWTAGVIVAPAVVLLGGTVKTSWAAGRDGPGEVARRHPRRRRRRPHGRPRGPTLSMLS